jgi:hypothetical protein
MELARLRGPEEIRRRAKEFDLNLVPPAAAARKVDKAEKTSD